MVKMTSRYSICIGQDTVTVKGHLSIQEAFQFLSFYEKAGFKCLTYPKQRDYDDDDSLYYNSEDSHSKVCFCLTTRDLCGEYSEKADNSRIEQLQERLDQEVAKSGRLQKKVDALSETELFKSLEKEEEEKKEYKDKLAAVENLMNEEVQRLTHKLNRLTTEISYWKNRNKKLELLTNPQAIKIMEGGPI